LGFAFAAFWWTADWVGHCIDLDEKKHEKDARRRDRIGVEKEGQARRIEAVESATTCAANDTLEVDMKRGYDNCH